MILKSEFLSTALLKLLQLKQQVLAGCYDLSEFTKTLSFCLLSPQLDDTAIPLELGSMAA